MIKLHQAKLSDTFDVLHVLNTALSNKLAYNDNAWGTDRFTTSEILPHIEAGELYIVIASGDVTGAVVLLESDENMWGKDGLDGCALYIHKLASLDKGLGAQMISSAELIAKKRNKTYLRLDCSFKNKALHGYYINQGFSEVRRTENEHQRIVLMQKNVC